VALRMSVWTALGEVVPTAVFENRKSPHLILTLHLFFTGVSTVDQCLVLTNLLIDMMTDKFAKETNSGRDIWWFEYASLVLRYEDRLKIANKFHYRFGTFDRYFL
jgi:hypothetical protein